MSTLGYMWEIANFLWFLHACANASMRGGGRNYKYGELARIVHIIQAKKFDYVPSRCAAMCFPVSKV